MVYILIRLPSEVRYVLRSPYCTSEEVKNVATWNASDRSAAIAKGLAGGKLSSHERDKLTAAARQAGSTGRAAKIALDKAKK